MMAEEAAALLAFWFGPRVGPSRWFGADAGLDAELRTRFAGVAERAAARRLDAWADTARDALALVLACDQLPRNIHRGTALAFAQDAQALVVADGMVGRGLDRELPPLWRLFVALPFEHAESLREQDRAVAYLAELEAQVSEAERPQFARFTAYARRHREVIARFGRFVGRNAALGRPSTDEERAALARGEAAF